MKSELPVAIVGGGFSGTMVAAQLARRGIGSVLIDGSGQMGRGTAFATRQSAHLLNVRAEGMSAWPDEPRDFARRFEDEGGDSRGFAERQLFGRYLGDILAEAVGSGAVATSETTACTASHDRGVWTVALNDGGTIQAGALVLATGNQAPEILAALSEAGDRFIANPWSGEAQAAIAALAETGGDALIVGTGLTMVDLALALDAAGHRGKTLALSRRGLIPRSHADFDPAAVSLAQVPQRSPRALLHWLRRRTAEVGWRAAIDSLRPHSHALWQGFDQREQRRFLRHARPWWDVHRHRIAPDVAATVARMVADGRLEIIAGKIVSATDAGGGVRVEYRRRGASATQATRVAYAFNCTGPLHSISRTRDPLLRSLLDVGLVQPDDLGIGLDVDQRSRACAVAPLWAVGPLTKGRYWEIVAVPDIREQAATVAEDIAQELGG